jgi:hypothetical protein
LPCSIIASGDGARWPSITPVRRVLFCRPALAGAFALAALLALVALGLRRWRRSALAAYLVLFAILLAWWFDIEPSNDREWQPDVAKLAYATIEGDKVTVHNIRNFAYRSETDYTPAWYDKTYDLSKLEGVDLVAVYWMGPAIAHTFVSFAFRRRRPSRHLHRDAQGEG